MNDITYAPDMCGIVIEVMRNGGLPEDVAKKLGVDIDTLTDWCNQFTEFNEAMSCGSELSMAYWEREMRLNLCNPAYDYEHWCNVMVEHFGWQK